MRILISIDQKEALRQGIDAPKSTAHVEFDPSELTPDEREVLANQTKDGYDASGSIRLVEPTIERLRALLGQRVEKRREERAETERRRAQVEGKLRQAIQGFREGTTTKTVTRALSARTGGIIDGSGVATREKEIPHVENVHIWNQNPDPELYAEYRRCEEEERQLERQAREELDALLPETPEWQEYLARRDAKQQEYDALFERLPETLRQRASEGYATDDELREAVKRLILEDAGIGDWELVVEGSLDRAPLSDEEYRQLRAAQERFPDIEIEGGARSWYREADEADDPDDIDKDGDVLEERRGMQATVDRAGLHVRAFREFRES